LAGSPLALMIWLVCSARHQDGEEIDEADEEFLGFDICPFISHLSGAKGAAEPCRRLAVLDVFPCPVFSSGVAGGTEVICGIM
jgi:hypothetical protein